MKKNRIKEFLKKHKGIIATVLLVGIAFIGVFKMQSSTVHEMGGMHSWLSGSTIKFVNNWLDEGAANLKFTNYENPASIEFEDLSSREPYLSYPTGETFFVYFAARLTGRQQISVSFLHKFQIIMFGIEAILLACFIYYFLTRTVKIKNELEKVIIAALVAVLWMVLPACSYYLTNIYFADQCVILWVMGFVLIEYMLRTSDKKNTWLKILRSIVIFTGVLVDYYFWFVALMLFVAELLEVWVNNKKKERKKKLLAVFCWFGIPTILALVTYYIQLSMTDGWFGIMMGKFGERVVGEGKTAMWCFERIYDHFSAGFTFNTKLVPLIIGLSVVTMVGSVWYLIVKKRAKRLINNPGISVVLFSALAIVMQVYFFKQHSAIHEFSIVKIGWIIALLPLLITVACYYIFKVKNNYVIRVGKFSISNFFALFLIFYLSTFILVGLPNSSANYRATRFFHVDYSFETMINENTNYEDVVFSYTKDIPFNPPQSLAISKKRVYKIDDAKTITGNMSKLREEAKAVLAIDKTAILEGATRKQQECLKNKGTVRFEDDRYVLVQLEDYDTCYVK